jgi:transcription antitermination factor NusA-like protein
MTPEFRYESTQVHSDIRNGSRRTKTQRVTIRGKKGHKEVTIQQNGKRSKTSKKKLSKKEIECIRKCQFIPGLFKDCERCVK